MFSDPQIISIVKIFKKFVTNNSHNGVVSPSVNNYDGLHGFYKGISTKIVQSVIAAAVLFMVKEELVNGARWLLLKDAANVVKS
ncbi:putative mitochondrial carrier domain protein [Helianthus annuus]|uniref:Mitochondrial carrier domain protein n=1 Tax=Helianthus annuus TaxID=4232 RepID=A0A9K3JP53_HELAN|nr:putative mitochondrial carrier domain protein [Helianthus annuus]KAJ0615558.1 putative mitochondrial carrier domain superfamily [Helianthus annuus]KAJ0951982.1 putative mitochondrial carrier domain protein [Helianthus annuus]